MKPTRTRFVALAAAAILALGACSADTGTTPNADQAQAPGASVAEQRVTIRLAASETPVGYPTRYGVSRGPGWIISSLMFDTLGWQDASGEIKPWLARSWETSPDGKTWTFRLRDNAKWHDGQPVTADDVVFTFDYNLKGPAVATRAFAQVNYVTNVASPDPKTVVVTLDAPRATFLDDIVGSYDGMSILPKHIWQSVTDPAKFQGDQALVGSGPYKMRQFDQTTNTFDFVANDDFYLGPPKVKEIQMVKVGDPLLALQQGELHAASSSANLPQAQMDALSRDFKLYAATGEFNHALYFNLTKGFPYDQKAFRQAVAFALDRKDMVQRLYNGRGVPGTTGGLGPASPFVNPRLPDYAFDARRAGAMLDQLGLRDANGDGVRDRPDGSSFTIPLLTSASNNATATLLVEQLRAVGLKVDVQAVDQPTSDARDTRGEYEMAIVSFGGLSDDPGYLGDLYSTQSRPAPWQAKGFANSELDRLASEQGTTVDVNKRKDIINRMQAILAEELPQLSLFVPQQIAFANDKEFKGWGYTPRCPPCGIALNKRFLQSGNAETVPGS